MAPGPPADPLALLVGEGLRPVAAGVQGLDELGVGGELLVLVEDVSDDDRFLLVDGQVPWLLGVEVVAEDAAAPVPEATLCACEEVGGGPLRGHLPLELRERHSDGDQQPAHRVGRVELLLEADQVAVVLLEKLHELEEVDHRSTEPRQLGDDQAVDAAGLDVRDTPPRCRGAGGSCPRRLRGPRRGGPPGRRHPMRACARGRCGGDASGSSDFPPGRGPVGS